MLRWPPVSAEAAIPIQRIRLSPYKANPQALCQNCHDMEDIAPEGTHPPVASGECLTCHTPHGSKNKALLAKSEKQLCLDCHTEVATEMAQASSHKPAKEDCSLCHQAHGKTASKLLTKDVNTLCLDCHTDLKAALTETNVHPPFADGVCTDCHRPHGSQNAKLLKNNDTDLCGSCHDDANKWIAQKSVHVTGQEPVSAPSAIIRMHRRSRSCCWRKTTPFAQVP